MCINSLEGTHFGAQWLLSTLEQVVSDVALLASRNNTAVYTNQRLSIAMQVISRV